MRQPERNANLQQRPSLAILLPMKPRHSADYRTLLWALLFFPAVTFAPYANERLTVWLLPLSAYVGFCAGVFAHNHNHCPTFRSRAANTVFSAWVSVFYGHPIFAWIPTHNLNHHTFLNREGDATITWRYSKKNTWLVASTYFFVSAFWQDGLIKAFARRARRSNPRLHRQIRIQKLTFRTAHAGLLASAMLLHGWRLGALVYAGTFGVSVACGLWGMMFINFIQHVHCDPWSAHDHSRNFVSKLGNFLVFNNGFHTAHHENPGAHWSTLPALHARIARAIDPELCQKTVFEFCVRAYALGALVPRFRTKQVGCPAYAAPA
jgi:fatty acid desaturase